MESIIDILFDDLVNIGTAWDEKHDKATQAALVALFEKLNIATEQQTKIGEIVGAEVDAQGRAAFRAGFMAAMKLCEEIKEKAE